MSKIIIFPNMQRKPNPRDMKAKTFIRPATEYLITALDGEEHGRPCVHIYINGTEHSIILGHSPLSAQMRASVIIAGLVAFHPFKIHRRVACEYALGRVVNRTVTASLRWQRRTMYVATYPNEKAMRSDLAEQAAHFRKVFGLPTPILRTASKAHKK